MGRLQLFYRLMVRPMLREPVRLGLTILAVAIGVAVVLAIELAGSAAVGSFHSSMETLSGSYTLEIVAVGGVPDSIIAKLATQPVPLRYSARIESYATVVDSKETLPLIGIDMIAEGSEFLGAAHQQRAAHPDAKSEEIKLEYLLDPTSVWVGSSLQKKPGDKLQLLIGDRTEMCVVRGVYPDANGTESAIVMDLAAAESLLRRPGRVDRILLNIPKMGTRMNGKNTSRPFFPRV